MMLHEQPAQTQLEATTAHALLASLVMEGLAVSYGDQYVINLCQLFILTVTVSILKAVRMATFSSSMVLK